jgi:hypothetical protein
VSFRSAGKGRSKALDGNPLVFSACPSLGVVQALVSARAVTPASIERARDDIRRCGGHLIVERCPDALAREVDVWGPPASGMELASGLKQVLDPKRRFNPGRFVGRL